MEHGARACVHSRRAHGAGIVTPTAKAVLRAVQPRAWRGQCRYLVAVAIRNGSLTSANRCESCGNTGRVQAHHHDYSRPLDVQWLCMTCHRALHHAAVCIVRVGARPPRYGIGERIHAARTKAKLSLAQTWQASGVHWSALSAIENGHREPTLRTIQRLASAFAVKPSALVGERDDRVA